MKKHGKNIKKEINQMVKGENRRQALHDGSYDGRFRTRIVKNKKKAANKLACRKFRYEKKEPVPGKN